MHGLILSGGRGTRLGPLSAQLPKCLLTIGQKPQVVRHVQQLRAAGCERIHVVVSPASKDAVDDVIERSGMHDVHTVVQLYPDGPGGAIREGLRGLHDDKVVVIMSDTILDDDDIPTEDDVVSCTDAPTTRSWCYPTMCNAEDVEWHDGTAKAGMLVSVGAYCFASSGRLYSRVSQMIASRGSRDGMEWVLNAYGNLRVHQVSSWLDIGDVRAMAAAQRSSFIARSHHTLQLDDRACIVKRGRDVTSQVEFIESLGADVAHLFPRVYETDRGSHDDLAKATSYRMDFIDLPSLAELWLYWPSRPDMWEHIGERLRHHLDVLHTSEHRDVQESWMRHAATKMYSDKMLSRYDDSFITVHHRESIVVNGRSIPVGAKAMQRIADVMVEEYAMSAHRHAGVVHGDPNFTNVLWSLRADQCKMIDPRGDWGNLGAVGDTRYDIAKVMYSPTFAAIVHRLFSLRGEGQAWTLNFNPKRREEEAALRSGFGLALHDTRLFEAYLLLSGAPLHDEPEATAMYIQGMLLADEEGVT